MSKLKTKPTKESARKFLSSIEPEQKRTDGLALLAMFEKATGEKPVMWGTSIVGFGKYHYKSERSTQEGDWPLVGFSPRKQNLTLYIMGDDIDNHELLTKLGTYKTSGGSCLYIKNLADIDQKILTSLIKKSYQYMKKKLL